MADLDDFFAKKDKKKGKGRKFTTPEELAKKLEDTSKRTSEPQKVKKDRSAISNTGAEDDEGNNGDQRQDEEWKDFEEERKDYSGLKIGQLMISEEEQNAANYDQDGDNGNNGSSDGEGNAGSSDMRNWPWKKVTPAEEVTQIPVEVEKPVYVPPTLRNQMAKAPKVKNRVAPDITNEEYFPTLGAARPEEQRKKKNEPAFEEVRHGSRITRVQEVSSSHSVSVLNRFKALADDDS